MDFGCSFAIITVVPEAYALIGQRLEGARSVERGGDWWTVGELPASDGGSHLVVAGQPVQRSNEPAQAFATKLLRAWAPRHLLVADIGGGIHGGGSEPRDGLRLGDVVVGELLHYAELVKLVPGEDAGHARLARYITWQPLSPRLAGVGRDLPTVDPEWWTAIDTPRGDGSADAPVTRLGEIVAGDKLLSDPDAAEAVETVKRFDKALAVDMESVGVAVAALAALDDGLPVGFGVLRGISDFMDLANNQADRDDWKPYASDVAIAAALGIVRATPAGPAAGETDVERDATEELLRRLGDGAGRDEPPYPVPLRGEGRVLNRADALGIAFKRRGVVLVGDAGLGKTAILRQAARACAAPLEPFAVLVDLKRWGPRNAERLAADPSGADLLPSLDSVLRCAVQHVGAESLAEIASRRDVLLLVDGINEIGFGEGQRVLTCLDEWMRARPRTRVIVTDRTAGPFYDESEWSVLRLAPLDDADLLALLEERFDEPVAERMTAEHRSLLRIPYFLDRALRSEVFLSSRAEALRSFLADHAGLDDERLDALAALAFEAYSEQRRTLSGVAVEAAVGPEASVVLRQAGVIVDSGDEGQVRLSHQLEHDYLAARRLARDSALWTTEAFDAVTFRAASFDVISLVLEQVDPADRDGIVRQLYDWNWRAVITALAAVEQDGTQGCSLELRDALLAVVAEKRYDALADTATRAAALIDRFRGNWAEALNEAQDLDAMVDLVRRRTIEGAAPWFEQWRDLFCRQADRPLDEDEIGLLTDPDPVIGWTASNVVRRFDEHPDRSLQVRTIYTARRAPDAESKAIRWRAAHALGGWPTDDNADVLIEALNDQYKWVQYGAVRALMEIAATADRPLRDRVLTELERRVAELTPQALSQIAWAAKHRSPRPGWAEAVRPVLEACLSRQANETESERWTRRIARVEEFWQEQTTS